MGSLYNSLVKIIREKDRTEGGLWLQRFLERPQWWFDSVRTKIDSLHTLIDPDACPDGYLDYLLAIVGFTSRYSSIVSRLDANTKRRLVRLAVPMWKLLFTELGCTQMVRILTGKTPYIRDWFDFRTIVGEVIIGEDQVGYDFWVIGDAIARFDEYTSQIRVMDDGLLDETLLLELLQIMRPLNERFEVSLVDFLDLFQEGRAKWTTLFGVPAEITTNLVFKIPNGSVEQPSMPIAALTAFTDIVTMHKFNILGAPGAHNFSFFVQTANDRWSIQIVPGVLNNVELRKINGGVPVLVATASAPIVVGTTYKLRVRSFPTVGGKKVYVFLDSVKVIDLTEPLPYSDWGGLIFNASGSDIEIDNVELYRNPLRWATIEPAGTTIGPGWVA